MKAKLLALLNHPLLWFMVAGAVIFALPGTSEQMPSAEVVNLSRQDLDYLRKLAPRTLKPLDAEATKPLRPLLEQELLYREALRLGLERNDSVIRRRLLQKMEFLIVDRAEASLDDSDAALQRLYQKTLDQWRSPPTISFKQYFFSDSRGRAKARDAAAQMLEKLKNGVLPAVAPGDAAPFPLQFRNASMQKIRHDLGADFAQQVFDLPEKQWQGPMSSRFGWHLVYVQERRSAAQLSFEQVRKRLRALALDARKAQVRREILAAAASHVELSIEGKPVEW